MIEKDKSLETALNVIDEHMQISLQTLQNQDLSVETRAEAEHDISVLQKIKNNIIEEVKNQKSKEIPDICFDPIKRYGEYVEVYPSAFDIENAKREGRVMPGNHKVRLTGEYDFMFGNVYLKVHDDNPEEEYWIAASVIAEE